MTSFVRFLVLALLLGAGGWWYVHGSLPFLPAGGSAREAAGAAPEGQAAQGGGGRRGGGGGPNGPVVPVVTAAAERSSFPIRRRTIGWAEPVATVAIKARLDSQIMETRVADGQMVREGDVLLVLDDREIRAQIAQNEAQLARDRAVLERTRADLTRRRELASRGNASQQAVDQAVADEASAQATVQGDEALLALNRVRLTYTQVRAPITGRVGSVNVTTGNLVRAADTNSIVTITQLSPIRVSFPLPERDLVAVKDALSRNEPPPVRVFQSGMRDRPLASGRAGFLDSAVDIQSGTVTVKAVFDNADSSLWPGQFLDVEIDTGSFPDATVVPTIAVQPGQSGPYVFVVKPDHTVEIRPVAVAASDGGRTALTQGLNPGERVVTDGQMRLLNGSRVREASETAAPAAAPGSPQPQREQPPRASSPTVSMNN